MRRLPRFTIMDIRLDSLAWIGKADVTGAELARMQRDLCIHPRGFNGDRPEPVNVLFDGGDCWGMPVRYGLKSFQTKLCAANPGEVMAAVRDSRSEGTQEVFDTRPVPRDPRQARFFLDMLQRMLVRPVTLAEAPTGSGKTVAALNAIAELGRSALIIVPTCRILEQWVKMATDPNILGLDPERVGTIQGGKFKFEGKAVTVALIHNLTKPEKLPEGFYEAFGTAVWDEAHNLGARTFSRSMNLVPAKHKLAMSATPDRKDGCENLFLYHFGPPCVVHEGEALRARCRVYDYQWEPGNDIGKKPLAIILKIVAASKRRTAFCVRKVLQLYSANRSILCITHEIGNAQDFVVALMDAGVPGEDVGLYASCYFDERGKRKALKQEDLDYVAENCRIIVATYGMAKEGLDIPRLDAGIDLTPQSKGVQVIGRIRRPLHGKPLPLWVTIRDRGIPKLEGFTKSRLRDYRDSNVEVIESGKA